MQTPDVYALLKEPKRLLTFEEVRIILHISESTLRRWVASCALILRLLQRRCGTGQARTTKQRSASMGRRPSNAGEASEVGGDRGRSRGTNGNRYPPPIVRIAIVLD
jgi:hypothetical protein